MHRPLGPGGGGRSRLARHGAELETTAAVEGPPEFGEPPKVGKHTGSLGGPAGAGPLAPCQNFSGNSKIFSCAGPVVPSRYPATATWPKRLNLRLPLPERHRLTLQWVRTTPARSPPGHEDSGADVLEPDLVLGIGDGRCARAWEPRIVASPATTGTFTAVFQISPLSRGAQEHRGDGLPWAGSPGVAATRGVSGPLPR